MSKKVRKQKKRNTKKFRKNIKSKIQNPNQENKQLIRDINFLNKLNDKFVFPTEIINSERVLFTPSYKTLNPSIQNQIENHLSEYPIIKKGCFVNGTLLSLKVSGMKTVHGYYGNTIESEFGVKGSNPNHHRYSSLINICLNSNEKYIEVEKDIILDTQKKKIWYKHCWNKVGDVHIDMTVEIQRLNNNSFNGFMEYLECDSFDSSSMSEFILMDKRGLTNSIYNSQSGIKYYLN